MPIQRLRHGLGRVVLGLAMIGPAVAPQPAQAGLNTWTTAGPEGGSIEGVAFDPETARVVYVSAGASIFKSTTRGEMWAPLTFGLPTGSYAGPVAVDPSNSRTLYVSTVVHEVGETSYARVLKSTDGGRSFRLSSDGLRVDDVFVSLVVDPSLPSTVYAWGTDGVFGSTDGGASWAPRSNGLTGYTRPGRGRPWVRAFAVDPKRSGILYASTVGDVTTPGALFKTTNGGERWVPANAPCCSAPDIVIIDPQTSTTLYAFTGGTGFSKSTDGGASWNPINSGIPAFPSTYSLALAIDPKTPSTLYAAIGYLGLFKTTNGGLSWARLDPGLDLPIQALVVDPHAPATLLAGTAGSGVFVSSDGGATWGPKNAAVRTANIRALAADPRSPQVLYAANDGGVVKSTNGGASWNALALNAAVSSMALDPERPSIVYAGTFFLGIFKSTDGGGSWTGAKAGLPQLEFIQALAIDPKHPAVVYAGLSGAEGVFKSTDAGATWAASSAGLGGLGVTSLAIDPQAPATLYAGTYYDTGIFKSTDGGATWTARNLGLPPNLRIEAVAVDPQTPTTVYVSVGNGVFKSTNGAASWTSSNVGLDGFVTALATDPRTPGTVYAGTYYGGVFRSTNRGLSWSLLSSAGLTDSGVAALALNTSGSCLHVATPSGVFTFATRIDAGCLPPPPLVAALSITSQSVPVGTAAQAFATVENLSGPSPGGAPSAAADGVAGVTCGITQLTGAPTPFTFQAVDASTHQAMAALNTPVDIPAASRQTYRITLSPQAPLCALDIAFGYNCTNTGLADIRTGINTLLLKTESPPTDKPCGLSTSVTANQPTFLVGQTLIAGGSASNPGLPDTVADFYVGTLRPDRSIEFVTSAGIVRGRADDPRSFRPLAVNVPLATPFTTSQPSVFTHEWRAADPRGSYVFFVAAVKAGALANGAITADQILSLATTSYSFP